MQEYIGENLQKVVNILQSSGIKYIIKDNNYSVSGDTKLVTNVQVIDKTVVLTTGDFIFDVRNKIDEKK